MMEFLKSSTHQQTNQPTGQVHKMLLHLKLPNPNLNLDLDHSVSSLALVCQKSIVNPKRALKRQEQGQGA